jgi:hypothetical protein
MRPLLWMSKNREKVARTLRKMGHKVSASIIPTLLKRLEYRRHINRKTKCGGQHPDRHAQFKYITPRHARPRPRVST